jgi:nucleoside phosphorylase/CheY-like chemotaxis protein
MKTLIVDDQYEDKARIIASVLKRVGASQVDLVADSKSAIRHMAAEKYDLLILDLQIPEILGEDALSSGGTQLLEFIEVNRSILRPTVVLGITSHIDAYEASHDFFRKRGWSLILGVDDEDRMFSVLSTMKAHVTNLETKFDIVFLTALPHVEYEAVMKLPLEWREHQEINDDNVYHSSTIELSDGSTKQVLATSLSHMGIAAAAAATASICVKFKPSLIVMTGICAGIQGRVAIGDILVADPSWDWGSGKLTVSDGIAKFLSAPTQVALDPALRRKIQHVATSSAYMNLIYSGWSGNRPPVNPRVHVGPVATGAVVLEDPQTVDLIRSQNRGTNGVEMEAYGVMAAAFNSGPNRPKVLAVKSVCDFADPDKNNDWQHYAAHTSTQFAYMFIKDHFVI